MTDSPGFSVTQDLERSRYVIEVGGVPAGMTAYRDADGVRTFTHTIVEPEFEGQGVGSALARSALDATRSSGLTVVARCPFIAGWIDRHPGYQDLVA